jgi:hypothetical protein
MTITNTGNQPDRLVGGALPQAGTFQVHEMKTEGGVMKMREVPGGLEIKPGQKIELKPGGYHVMSGRSAQTGRDAERAIAL